MSKAKGSYGATQLLRDTVFQEIKKFPHGVSYRALQRKFGVTSPMLEDQRRAVWKLSSVLVGLQHAQFIVSDLYDGERFYFPRAS